MTEIKKEASAENPAPKKRMGVMLATPLRHFHGPQDLPPQIGRALRELSERPDAQEYAFEFAAACGGLCSARNRVFHEFLASDNQWLFWHDADLFDQHGRQADAILRILSWRQPVVGGMYCKRDKRPRWVANWITAARPQLGGLLQVAELGGGFKCYHRRALTEVRRIFGEEPLKDPNARNRSIMYRERETGDMVCAFSQIRTVEGDLLSEDFWLDYLCRCAGIPIIADTVVRLRHHDGSDIYPPGAWPPIPAEDGQ